MTSNIPTKSQSKIEAQSEHQIHENLEFLINYAILAPSSHNSQPWKFNVQATAIDLYADRSRALPTIDPSHRELTISCGAALFNLRVAAQHFGYHSTSQIFPTANRDWLARLTLSGSTAALAADRLIAENKLLFEAIPKRHTNRLPFAQVPVPEYLLCELAAAAADEGAYFQLVAPNQRQTAVDLIAEGERLQLSDPLCRQELETWMHRNLNHGLDSIASYEQKFQDRELAAQAPLLAVISTDHDRREDWLVAGQAIQKVLLKLTVAGAASSFFNQPIEAEHLRHQLQLAMDQPQIPQVLLRIGYGTKVRAAHRRRMAEALI
jgi:Nitroreductase family/Putative TM nitroreductase